MALTEPPPGKGVYLDWNATTPPHPQVLVAMQEAAREAWGNPASVHALGRRARKEVEALREVLAEALAIDARNVVLTSGGTEANNLALRGASGLVTSRLEHPSVLRVAEALAATGRPVHWVPVPPSGRLSTAEVLAACEGMPVGACVAIQAANHETGVLQHLEPLAPQLRDRGLRLHVDAVQAFGKVVLSGLSGFDSVSLAAHKLRGPKGIGALAFRSATPQPVLLGGSQERGLRPGTVDPVAAAGFRAAVELSRTAPSRWAALAHLRDAFEESLMPFAEVNGEGARLPHVSNLSFRGMRGDELVVALDLMGIHVSSGSACAAGTAEVSPVIESMLGRARAGTAVRFSLGETTTHDELREAKDAVVRILSRVGGHLCGDG